VVGAYFPLEKLVLLVQQGQEPNEQVTEVERRVSEFRA
jgi:hypothetical protein